MKKTIFVFGSNLAGIHGAGAALFARNHHGAKLGVGQGRTGGAYALPTKDAKLRTLPLTELKLHIRKFIRYAKNHPELSFKLTAVGCGLAGYKYSEIGPLFKEAPANVDIPEVFKKYAQR